MRIISLSQKTAKTKMMKSKMSSKVKVNLLIIFRKKYANFTTSSKIRIK